MSQCGDVDTFEHVLNVTAQNDSIYAYYYMDEDDKTVRKNISLFYFEINFKF